MIKLAIDFGTSVTKIYKLGSGIVLAEATAVTVQKDTGEIRAFGNEAKRLLGKTAEQTDVCFPVYEGRSSPNGSRGRCSNISSARW